jgi:AraC-like DNA-binding protein
MDLLWSTEAVAPAKRSAAWAEMLSRQVLPVGVDVASSRGFRGEFRLRSFGPTAFLRVRSRAQKIHRDAARIGRADSAWMFVSTMTEGEGWLHHGGGVAEGPYGGVTFVDGDQPFTLEFRDDFAFVSALVLRRDLVALLPRAAHAHGRVLPAPVGPALSAFLATLETAVDAHSSNPGRDENRLYDHFVGLAATALMQAAARDDRARARPSADELLLGRIKAHLIDRLDVEFDGPACAARFGISARKLQRLFQADGATPTGWLRRQRLQRCARDLADPRQAARSITAIARTRGFDDMVYFSRCFRREFGTAPGAWRGTHLPSRQT